MGTSDGRVEASSSIDSWQHGDGGADRLCCFLLTSLSLLRGGRAVSRGSGDVVGWDGDDGRWGRDDVQWRGLDVRWSGNDAQRTGDVALDGRDSIALRGVRLWPLP